MSFWTPLGPPPNQNNPPPAQNPNQGAYAQAPIFTGLGFQAANPQPNPFSFVPPNANAAQPAVNPFANTNNHASAPGGFNGGFGAPSGGLGGFGAPSGQASSSQASQHASQAPPPPAAAGNDEADDEEEDDDEDDDDEDPDNGDPDLDYDEVSPINLTIRVPLNVKGNNNTVAIDAGKLANQISHAMVSSLKELSCGGSGIPMLDHNGQPRPVKVKVDLKVTVTGDRNTIGEKAVLAMIPVAVRNAMVEGMLPVTPLSPLEDRVFTGVIDQLRTTGVNLKPHSSPDSKKRERDGSSDNEEGTDEAGPASSPKRSRFE